MRAQCDVRSPLVQVDPDPSCCVYRLTLMRFFFPPDFFLIIFDWVFSPLSSIPPPFASRDSLSLNPSPLDKAVPTPLFFLQMAASRNGSPHEGRSPSRIFFFFLLCLPFGLFLPLPSACATSAVSQRTTEPLSPFFCKHHTGLSFSLQFITVSETTLLISPDEVPVFLITASYLLFFFPPPPPNRPFVWVVISFVACGNDKLRPHIPFCQRSFPPHLDGTEGLVLGRLFFAGDPNLSPLPSLLRIQFSGFSLHPPPLRLSFLAPLFGRWRPRDSLSLFPPPAVRRLLGWVFERVGFLCSQVPSPRRDTCGFFSLLPSMFPSLLG